MAFDRPSLSALIERIASDIDARLAGSQASLPRTVEGVLARALAAAVHGLHGHAEWMSKQILPDTMEGEFLFRYGEAFGIERTAAAKASGTVNGTGTAATEIESGLELQTAEGVVFITGTATVDGSGNFSLAIIADEAGADGNLDASTSLRFTEPVSGIDSEVFVDASGITGGLDIESEDAYRTRLLARMAEPPKGGALDDYVAWAKEISGVTRAWAQANALGPGTVRVLFVRDDDGGSITPDADEISELQDYLQETDGSGNIIGGVAPIFAEVTAAAPTLVNLDVTVSVALADGYTQSEVEANIEAELEDMLVELAEPGGTIRLSHIREAVSRAEGESYHTLTAPVADQTHALTELPVLGSLTVNFL